MKPKFRHYSRHLPLATAIIASLSIIPSQAADWDTVSGDSIVTGGSGNWDLTTANWTTDAGVSNITWDSSTAVFGDTGGTVTVTEPVSAAGITFTADNYLVTGSTITLTGVVINAAGQNAEIASTLAGTVGLSVQGNSYLTLSGPNTYDGPTTIVATASAIAASNTAFGGTTDGVTVSNTGNLTLKGGVTITGETLSVRGAGPEAAAPYSGGLRNLSGDNSWTGDISLSNTLRAVCDSGTLTIGTVNMGTRGFILTGPGNITADGDLLGTSGGILVDMANNTLGTGGTLTLKGANTFTGAMTITNGKLSLEGNRTANSGAIMVGNGAAQTGTLDFKAGNFSTGSGWIQVGELTGTGIVNHTAGTLGTALGGSGLVLVGSGADSTGTYNLSGGELFARANNNNALILGTNSGTVGEFNLSDTGSLTMNAGPSAILQIGRCNSATTGSTGTFNQTGGTAVLRNIAMGGGSANNDGTVSKLDLSGGSFQVNLAISTLSAGINSSSEIIIRDTADVTLPEFPITRGAGSTATITFDGGTLRPRAASTTYMGGLDSAKIQDGGITFNVDTGNDIVISQELLTDDVSLGGGLTKAGLGALVLAGVNTYTGPTSVDEGILGLDTTGVIDASSTVTVAPGATLGGSGTVNGPITSSGSISPGTLGSGTLTTAAVTLTTGSLDVEVNGTTAGKLLSSGALDVSAIDLNVSEISPALAVSYVIAEGSSIIGTFNSENLPSPSYSVTYTGTQVILESGVTLGYATWAATNGIPGEPADGDFDNDSLDNIVEYALGTDPTVSSVPAGTYIGETLSFTKGADAVANGDVTYAIEESDDLGITDPWADVTPDVNDDTTISYTLPTGQPKVFARLKVVQIP